MTLKISDYMIAIVFFTIVVVGCIQLMVIFDNDDPDKSFSSDPQFANFNNSFNTLTNITNSTIDIQTKITSASPDQGLFGVLNSLMNTGWAIFLFTFVALGFMTTVFFGLTLFGVPVWLIGLIALLPILIIIFNILAAFFQRDI